MAGTAENAIYERLHSVQSFHPANANLFSNDWGLEPGDIVTVKSGEESYSVPVYSMDMKWNGSCMTEIQSTGNQKREPLPALRRREYASNARGYGLRRDMEKEVKQFETHFLQTDHNISLIATETDLETAETVGMSLFEITSGDITSLVQKTGVDSLGQGETLYSKITQNESSISSIVSQSGTVTAVFDPEKAGGYQAGDRVLYNGTAYRFTEAHTGAWTGTDVEAIGDLQSQITQTATGVESLVSKTGVNSLGQSETLYSKITQTATDLTSEIGRVEGTVSTVRQTAESVSAEVTAARDGAASLKSRIDAEAGKIALVVSSGQSGNTVNTASIIAAINGGTGHSEVAIEADNVTIGGNGTIKLSDSITVQGGEVFIEANTVDASFLSATEFDVDASGSLVSFDNGYFDCGSVARFQNTSTPVEFYGGISFVGSDTATISAADAGGIIKAVSIDNNILTLTRVDGTYVNFSKATAVSGNWSGNVYTVTATQTNRNTTTGQDETVNVGGTPISTTVTISQGTWAYDDDAKKYQQTLQIKDEGNNPRQTVYQDFPGITVSPVLTASGGTPSAIGSVKAYGPASGSTAYEVGSATVHLQRSNGYVYLTSDNNTPVIGTNVLARISAPEGSITAITGTAISASETELTPTITASGSNVSSLSASLTLANTTYTPQGASAASKCVTLTLGSTLIGRINIDSVYNAGVRAGEGKFTQATVTLQGNSVTVTKLKSEQSARAYYNRGTKLYRQGSLQLYKFENGQYQSLGNHVWYYENDNSSMAYWLSGTKVNCYDSGQLETVDMYEAGTPDSTTYYTKSS